MLRVLFLLLLFFKPQACVFPSLPLGRWACGELHQKSGSCGFKSVQHLCYHEGEKKLFFSDTEKTIKFCSDTVPEKGYLKKFFSCRKRLAVRTVRAETSRHNYLCITANTDAAHQNQSKYKTPFRSEQKSGLLGPLSWVKKGLGFRTGMEVSASGFPSGFEKGQDQVRDMFSKLLLLYILSIL